jgi:hypothetical protein
MDRLTMCNGRISVISVLQPSYTFYEGVDESGATGTCCTYDLDIHRR